ncbi:MAG: DUF1194 domain-containing protein [Alphaproteobacteria bacterium]|nr:DUF1194 domain-containing protein [Alphaproteobacteria bacterium]
MAGAALALFAGATLAAGEDVDLLLVLAVDVSRSIDDDEAALQRDGYARAFKDPVVIKAIGSGEHGAIAVAYVEWADYYHVREVIPWTKVDSPATAASLASAIVESPRLGGFRTSISAGIDAGAKLIREAPFKGKRKVIDVSGDGINNSGRPVTEARNEAVAQGITINGLVIMNDRWTGNFPPPKDLDAYFEKNVIGGQDCFAVVAEDFASFASALRSKLIREIAGIPGPAPVERFAAR